MIPPDEMADWCLERVYFYHCYDLSRDKILVGRNIEADLVCPDSHVSGKHCELYFADNRWNVRDLRSTNGVFINGEKMQGCFAQLKDTDVIGFGNKDANSGCLYRLKRKERCETPGSLSSQTPEREEEIQPPRKYKRIIRPESDSEAETSEQTKIATSAVQNIRPSYVKVRRMTEREIENAINQLKLQAQTSARISENAVVPASSTSDHCPNHNGAEGTQRETARKTSLVAPLQECDTPTFSTPRISEKVSSQIAGNSNGRTAFASLTRIKTERPTHPPDITEPPRHHTPKLPTSDQAEHVAAKHAEHTVKHRDPAQDLRGSNEVLSVDRSIVKVEPEEIQEPYETAGESIETLPVIIDVRSIKTESVGTESSATLLPDLASATSGPIREDVLTFIKQEPEELSPYVEDQPLESTGRQSPDREPTPTSLFQSSSANSTGSGFTIKREHAGEDQTQREPSLRFVGQKLQESYPGISSSSLPHTVSTTVHDAAAGKVIIKSETAEVSGAARGPPSPSVGQETHQSHREQTLSFLFSSASTDSIDSDITVKHEPEEENLAAEDPPQLSSLQQLRDLHHETTPFLPGSIGQDKVISDVNVQQASAAESQAPSDLPLPSSGKSQREISPTASADSRIMGVLPNRVGSGFTIKQEPAEEGLVREKPSLSPTRRKPHDSHRVKRTEALCLPMQSRHRRLTTAGPVPTKVQPTSSSTTKRRHSSEGSLPSAKRLKTKHHGLRDKMKKDHGLTGYTASAKAGVRITADHVILTTKQKTCGTAKARGTSPIEPKALSNKDRPATVVKPSTSGAAVGTARTSSSTGPAVKAKVTEKNRSTFLTEDLRPLPVKPKKRRASDNLGSFKIPKKATDSSSEPPQAEAEFDQTLTVPTVLAAPTLPPAVGLSGNTSLSKRAVLQSKQPSKENRSDPIRTAIEGVGLASSAARERSQSGPLSKKRSHSGDGATAVERTPHNRSDKFLGSKSDVLQRIYQWKPSIFKDQQGFAQPPVEISSQLQSPPDAFPSLAAYTGVYLSLILYELWTTLSKSYKCYESKAQRFEFSVENVEVQDLFTILRCRASTHVHLAGKTLLELQLAGDAQEPVAFFASLEKVLVQKEDGTSGNSAALSTESKGAKALTLYLKTESKRRSFKGTGTARLVGSLRKTLSQSFALKMLFPSSPLRDLILTAKPEGVRLKRMPGLVGQTLAPAVVSMKLDSTQREAVLSLTDSVLNEPETPKISLLQGPPGTGKTDAIVALVLNLLDKRPEGDNTKILVCAQSNVAVDEIVFRLAAQWNNSTQKGHLPLIRLGLKSHISNRVKIFGLDHVIKRAKQANTESGKVGNFADEKIKSDILSRAKVLASTVGSLTSPFVESLYERAKPRFLCCIIDEATQCPEFGLLQCLAYDFNKVVLVGQCGQSLDLDTPLLGRSLFTRISSQLKTSADRCSAIQLCTQYRMHPEISRWPLGDIDCSGGHVMNARLLDSDLHPYRMMDVRSRSKKFYGGEFGNQSEAILVANLVAGLCRADVVKDKSVKILTFYSKQEQLIRERIKQFCPEAADVVRVKLVQDFQGREADIVILSCVRTAETLNGGTLTRPDLLNLALTRARRSLIIVGNLTALAKNSEWKELVEDARSRNVLTEVRTKLSSQDLLSLVLKQEQAPL